MNQTRDGLTTACAQVDLGVGTGMLWCPHPFSSMLMFLHRPRRQLRRGRQAGSRHLNPDVVPPHRVLVPEGDDRCTGQP
jgi:hypothetical protein